VPFESGSFLVLLGGELVPLLDSVFTFSVDMPHFSQHLSGSSIHAFRRFCLDQASEFFFTKIDKLRRKIVKFD
jgi:hypothetical protein